MKKLRYPQFTLVYLIICLIIMLSEYFSLKWTYFLSKPLAMIAIYFFFRTQTGNVQQKKFKNLLLTGFILSCAGDIFLMLQPMNPNYFLIGLVAFLGAHICYTAGFIVDMFEKRPWNQHWAQLAFATLIVVYGAEFFILNRFSFGNLYFPVLIYCMAIAVMGVSAVMRDKYKNPGGYLKVVIGAVFFIISDSLLATNNFIVPFPFSGPMILGTYFVAQYLIATGCLVDLKRGRYAVEEKRD